VAHIHRHRDFRDFDPYEVDATSPLIFAATDNVSVCPAHAISMVRASASTTVVVRNLLNTVFVFSLVFYHRNIFDHIPLGG